MSKLFFVIADTVKEVDNSAEYITYHARYVTMSRRSAQVMMDFWQDEYDKQIWIRKVLNNVKGFRIVEIDVCEDFDLLYIQDFHIHFRTLEVALHPPFGIDAMQYINVHLHAVYDHGLSQMPRMHKDRFNNKIITVHE
jgi:hypothetical protein